MADFPTLLAKVHNRTILASEVNDPSLKPHERDALVKAITEKHSQSRTGVAQRAAIIEGQIGAPVVFNFATNRVDDTKPLKSWGFTVLENAAADDVIVNFDSNVVGGQNVVITEEGVSWSTTSGQDEEITSSPQITVLPLSGPFSSVKVLVTYEEIQ